MQITPIPAFEDNYIWALRHQGRVAVVDPGEASAVERYLARSGEQLCAILVTHHHADHIGGIAELLQDYAVPVYGPAREAQKIVSHPLRDGDSLALAELDVEFSVIEVPGHTLGHIAYYACAKPSHEGTLLCGDVIFGAGCGRVFEGTLPQMQATLARLAALPAATRVYPAHEYTEAGLKFAKQVEADNPAIDDRLAAVQQLRAAGKPSLPSSLADELATNPFLRWQAPGVIASAGRQLGHPPANDVECFSAIRIWRDQL